MGGLEETGAIDAIQSLLMLADDGVLHLFPGWPNSASAAFTTLRANGAFLVSARYDGPSRNVTQLSVQSVVGRVLRVLTPWPGAPGLCVENATQAGARSFPAKGSGAAGVYQLATVAGGSYRLRPGGTCENAATHNRPLSAGCVKHGVARASCFGFNATDATDVLQAAFESGASTVVVDAPARGNAVWIVRPLFLQNVTNIHVALAPGVTIMAKRNEFHGPCDSLLRLQHCRNVTVSGGPGSTLRMRRDDYAVPSRGTCPQCSPYSKAEWRSTVWLEPTAVGVRFVSLHLTESGGDGFLVNGAHNVSIQGCLVDRHYRQGMSVGSVYGLHVVDTTFVSDAPRHAVPTIAAKEIAAAQPAPCPHHTNFYPVPNAGLDEWHRPVRRN